MALYFLLGTLNAEGARMLHENPNLIMDVSREIEMSEGTRILGQYAVLGHYDFVTMVLADDNEAVGEVSLELGVRAGLHIETLPAIPVGFSEGRGDQRPDEQEAGAERRVGDGIRLG